MSTINQIEKALLEINSAEFQKLADSYLYKKGYENINALGSVLGANKTKTGTPDSFIPVPNGKFVFAEYTTQQTGLYKKIDEDIDKCLDKKKTGIPVEQIEELIFCYTSSLSTSELQALTSKCQANGVNCNFYGINAIAFDLYGKFPKLALDFLGVEVDTGQIVHIDDFVSLYDESRLAVRLDTKFHFRNDELKDALESLDKNNLVVISGNAGVGKSRVALEACRQFGESNPDFAIWCIINRGPNIYNDLRSYFSEPGNYLILVDDANRLRGFNYLVDFVLHPREDQSIKIIVTVRDYALDIVLKGASPLTGVAELNIQPLTEDEIKKLIEDECGIKNHLFLERIYTISQGNARLAVMAAEVALKEGTFDSISNVAGLYDEYFESIKQDLENIGQEDLLKVAGIVSFLRIVDRTNEDLMGTIYKVFNIIENDFWNSARSLHELEVFDMYENEVVRFSDQVLATYLFYLAFFKEKLLDFSVLLNTLFPRYRSELIDAINPVLNNFDSDKILKIMKPYVDTAWNITEIKGGEDFLHLMEAFWFLKPTKTLSYSQQVISKMPTAPEQIVVDIKADSNIPSPSILNALSNFRHLNDENFEKALRLILEYFEKAPDQLGKAFYLLADRFAFDHRSHQRNYSIQKIVMDVLWEHSADGKNEMFSLLYIAVSEQYLHTHFHVTEAKGNHAITMIDFRLLPSPEVVNIRQTIWKNLFLLYEIKEYREKVLESLRKYSTAGMEVDVKDIIEEDSKSIIPFFGALDGSQFRNCLLAHDYFDLLETHELPLSKSLKNKFKTVIYETYELLEMDRLERRNLGLDYKEFEELRKNRIQDNFAVLSFDDCRSVFDQCAQIMSALDRNEKKYQVRSGLCIGLIHIGDIKGDLFAQVMEYYLESGDPLHFSPPALIEKMIASLGPKRSFGMINSNSFATKRDWLFGYYFAIPEAEIRKEDLEILYSLYEKAEIIEPLRDLDYLLKFRNLDPNVLVSISETILKRGLKDARYFHALMPLFNHHSEVNKILNIIYESRCDLLKKLYFSYADVDKHMDYDGSTFALILEMDSGFSSEYIDYMFTKKEWLTRHDDHRDYSFIWLRNDFMQVMTNIAEKIYDHEEASGFHSFIETFFTLKSGNAKNEEIIERQDAFLSEMIQKHSDDGQYVKFIFNLLSEETISFDRMLKFLSLFLTLNKNIDVFEQLSLFPSSMGWSGSAVPVYQKRVDDLEKILPRLDTIELLWHKLHIEERIEAYRKQVEAEKKRDFKGSVF
ncbi:MAG: nSTAND3 domain-containing NTPase [Thermoleophilia bacterium]